METINQTLLNFFQALADANRLRIVGVLAQGPQSVEQLSALLDMGMSTASHHLRKLASAGLVEAKAEGHYSIYSLRTQTLEELAKSLLSRETLPKLAGQLDVDAYERKVLQTFTDTEGRIIRIPGQEKKFLVLVRYVLGAFEHSKRYNEKQVNAILEHYHQDTALLRRALVDYGYMQREVGGKAYWRVD